VKIFRHQFNLPLISNTLPMPELRHTLLRTHKSLSTNNHIAPMIRLDVLCEGALREPSPDLTPKVVVMVLVVLIAWAGQATGQAGDGQSGSKYKKQRGQISILPLESKKLPPKDKAKSEGGKSGAAFVSPTLKAEFVLIPAGSYPMGSPVSEGGRDIDENLHQVTLIRPFFLQTTEVTQWQWEKVMGENPSQSAECGGSCPVENVSWRDVQKFIEKLNALEGTDLYRLPTEAEWEYAARAGTVTAFHWGNYYDCKLMNYGNSIISRECKGFNPGTPMKVGSFEPNGWGLFDMHGNVWEWVQDAADWQGRVVTKTYRDDVVDPVSNEGELRVHRGGSWMNRASDCRAANRSISSPDARNGMIGFRLLRERSVGSGL